MESSFYDEPMTLKIYKQINGHNILPSSDDYNQSNINAGFRKPFSCKESTFNGDFGDGVSCRVPNNYTVIEKHRQLPLPSLKMINHKAFWQQSSCEITNLNDPIVLTRWRPTLLVGSRLAFFGIKINGDTGKFTDIHKRYSNCLMATNKGILYKLCGPMKPNENVPQFIRKMFECGIPENWYELSISWGRYVTLGNPKTFNWTYDMANKSKFIEMRPNSSVNSAICPINSSEISSKVSQSVNTFANSNTILTESSMSRISSRSLKKKIAKYQAMLKVTLLRESMSQSNCSTINMSDKLYHKNVKVSRPVEEKFNTPTSTSNSHQQSKNSGVDSDHTHVPFFTKCADKNIKIVENSWMTSGNQSVSNYDSNTKNVINNNESLYSYKNKPKVQIISDELIRSACQPEENIPTSNTSQKENISNDPGNKNKSSTNRKSRRSLKNDSGKSDKSTHRPKTRSKSSKLNAEPTIKFKKGDAVTLNNWTPIIEHEKSKNYLKISGDITYDSKICRYTTKRIKYKDKHDFMCDVDYVKYTLVGNIYDPCNEIPTKIRLRLNNSIPRNWSQIINNKDQVKHKTAKITNNAEVTFQIPTAHSKFNISVSKKGRIVMPSLKFWEGERFSVDESKQTEEIISKESPVQTKQCKMKNTSFNLSLLKKDMIKNQPVIVLTRTELPIKKSDQCSSKNKSTQMKALSLIPESKIIRKKANVMNYKSKKKLKDLKKITEEACNYVKSNKNPKNKVLQELPQSKAEDFSRIVKFSDVLNGTHVPQKRRLFSMDTLNFIENNDCIPQYQDGPRFEVNWNVVNKESCTEDNVSDISAFVRRSYLLCK